MARGLVTAGRRKEIAQPSLACGLETQQNCKHFTAPRQTRLWGGELSLYMERSTSS